MTIFSYKILAGSVQAGKVNIIDRLFGVNYNIGDRYEEFVPEIQFNLQLFISPSQLEVQAQARLTFALTDRFGVPVSGAVVQFFSSDPSVGPVPNDAFFTDANGSISFGIIAFKIGAFTVTAQYSDPEIEFVYQSNSVVVNVVDVQQPELYNATGIGRIVIKIEPTLSLALEPRVQRLSNTEQRRKFPNDSGCSRLSFYESREVVFFPKWMTR